MDREGLAGLVPAQPGPRRAHKLTDEVVAFARRLREQDPGLGSAQLVDAIAARFGIRVHPRSVERALARAESPKSGGGNDIDDTTGDGSDVVDGYEQLRARALCRRRRRVAAGAGGAAAARGRRMAAGAPGDRAAGPRPTPARRCVARGAGGVDAELVGLLASMALAVAARG